MTTRESRTDMFKRALGATTRALSGKRALDVRFGGDKAAITDDAITLPVPAVKPSARAIASARGKADALALRLAHHNAKTHARLCPGNQQGRAVFEALEQVRCETLGASALKGAGENMQAALAERCAKHGFASVSEREAAPLAEAVALIAREHITGVAAPKEAEGLLALWRGEIEDKGRAALSELHTGLDNQSAFAALAKALLDDLDLGDLQMLPEQKDEEEQSEEGEGNPSAQDGEENPGDSEDTTPDGATDQGEGDESEQQAELLDDESDVGDAQDGAGEDLPVRPNYQPGGGDGARYHVFTTKHDEEVRAEDLCDAPELTRLRSYLDRQLDKLRGAVARLANKLQRRLMAQQQRSWIFDLEEGVLDPARLTRVITDPLAPLSFKEESETDFRDTVVTLLLDNSGSMRGRPIMIAALTADILSRTLERCGVKVEILGFTTRAWKGGQSKEDWLAANKPLTPGRLNDLRHIIYKAADVPMRRAKNNLGLMMREGLLKENIDGEALLWAHTRLQARPEARRILMVISDGAPVDDTTQSHNPGGYLEAHLREVIAEIEDYSDVQLIAIGIGHDVTRWYSRAVTLTDAEQLGGAITEQLASLFDEKPVEPRRRRA
ncbi:MAG: cobaltochelatase subunit CobT [Robiginitomaculum sp.]|nr:MAG: cobaltochelatase subunit CobT [Robiginitomaculum sp.]